MSLTAIADTACAAAAVGTRKARVRGYAGTPQDSTKPVSGGGDPASTEEQVTDGAGVERAPGRRQAQATPRVQAESRGRA